MKKQQKTGKFEKERIQSEITKSYHLIETGKYDEAISNFKRLKNEADENNFTNLSTTAFKHMKQAQADKLQHLLKQSLLLMESGNQIQAVEDLNKLKDLSERYYFPKISVLAEKYIKQIQMNIKAKKAKEMKQKISESTHLIESGNYDEAIISLQKILSGINQKNEKEIYDLATKSIKQAEMFKTLIKLFKISNRLKIDDICDQLERSRKEMLKIFVEWGDKFGVKIDGDYAIIENTDNLNSMMFDLLERSFDEWNDKEQTKEGKI